MQIITVRDGALVYMFYSNAERFLLNLFHAGGRYTPSSGLPPNSVVHENNTCPRCFVHDLF